MDRLLKQVSGEVPCRFRSADCGRGRRWERVLGRALERNRRRAGRAWRSCRGVCRSAAEAGAADGGGALRRQLSGGRSAGRARYSTAGCSGRRGPRWRTAERGWRTCCCAARWRGTTPGCWPWPTPGRNAARSRPRGRLWLRRWGWGRSSAGRVAYCTVGWTGLCAGARGRRAQRRTGVGRGAGRVLASVTAETAQQDLAFGRAGALLAAVELLETREPGDGLRQWIGAALAADWEDGGADGNGARYRRPALCQVTGLGKPATGRARSCEG